MKNKQQISNHILTAQNNEIQENVDVKTPIVKVVHPKIMIFTSNLKIIGRLGVGLDNINVSICKEKNFSICEP